MNEENLPKEETQELSETSIEALEEYFEISARTRFMTLPRWME
jgi:hypothetical protein